MTDKRAAKRKRYTGKAITIRVGNPANEEFICHDSLLKEDSPFFRAALDKKWREGRSLEIDRPEDEPETVSAYVSWLYDGEIDPPSATVDDDFTYIYLAKLYVFGEKVQHDNFCNAVVNAIVASYDVVGEEKYMTPSSVAVQIMYRGTPSESPGRRVFVELSCLTDPGLWKANELKSEPDFAADLVEALQKRLSKSRKLAPSGLRAAEWYRKSKQ